MEELDSLMEAVSKLQTRAQKKIYLLENPESLDKLVTKETSFRERQDPRLKYKKLLSSRQMDYYRRTFGSVTDP